MRVPMQAAGVVGVFVVGLASFVARAADDAQPKYTIKQVMTMAHKEGLLKKVTSGQGSPADAEKLLELYQALAENKPPKGELASWKEKTDALVAAAQAVVDGKEGAGPKLQKAANCAACHKEHKPPA
ncbi:MAG: hypothetical protein AB7O59_21350 [Pirellulales bacterium]